MTELPDWVSDIAVALVASVLAGLFLSYFRTRGEVRNDVDEDPSYREELAAELRGERIGGLYRHTLESGLDWLDRRFGPANSQRALGICIIIALYYAYAAFFLAWGVGGRKDLAGNILLDQLAPWLVRAPAGIFFVTLPPLAYLLGRWLGKHECRIKLRLHCHHHWRAWLCELGRGASAVLLLLLLAAGILVASGDPQFAGVVPVLVLWAGIGPSAGALVGWMLGSTRFAQALAVVSGAAAGAFATFWVDAVLGHGALTATGASTIALATMAIGALGLALVLSVALAGSSAIVGLLFVGSPSMGDEVFAFFLVIAGAAAAGALHAHGWRRSVFAGGLGALAGVGLLGMLGQEGGRDYFTIVILVLFILLPLVNGLWDWLSWWVSRLLGRGLLAVLQPEISSGGRAWTVAWHSGLDLGAAVVLLAAMAYLLAFSFAFYHEVVVLVSDVSVGAFSLGTWNFIGFAAARPWTDGLLPTVMLISTLVPTFLHFVVLAASPIALVTLPTEKRLALAHDLETYDAQPEQQAGIRRRAADYVARGKHGAIALSTFLVVLLLAAFGGFIALIHTGGLADYVLTVAIWGVHTARGIAGLF